MASVGGTPWNFCLQPNLRKSGLGKAAFGIVSAVKDASAFCAGFPGTGAAACSHLCYTHSRVTAFTVVGQVEQGSGLSAPGHIRRLHHSLTFLGQCSPQKVSLGYSILLRMREQVMELTKDQ